MVVVEEQEQLLLAEARLEQVVLQLVVQLILQGQMVLHLHLVVALAEAHLRLIHSLLLHLVQVVAVVLVVEAVEVLVLDLVQAVVVLAVVLVLVAQEQTAFFTYFVSNNLSLSMD
jgi:hypothetical protein